MTSAKIRDRDGHSERVRLRAIVLIIAFLVTCQSGLAMQETGVDRQETDTKAIDGDETKAEAVQTPKKMPAENEVDGDAKGEAKLPTVDAMMPAPEKRNLFGELIGDGLDSEKSSASASPMLQRVKGLVERTSTLTSEYTTMQSRLKEITSGLQEKTVAMKGLPNEYERATLTLVNIQLKLGRMRTANVLSMPPNDPNVIAYRQSNLQAQQLEAEIKTMIAQSKALPGQIQSMKNELGQVQNKLAAFPPQCFELIASWDSVSTPLRWLSPSDLKAIGAVCEGHLAQYPDAHLVKLMSGYSHLHLKQNRKAVDHFETVLKKLGSASDPISSSIRFKATLGLAWAAIAEQDNDLAGKSIADASRFSKRDYELALVKGLLLQLRGQSGSAFDQFRRAVSINKESPHGYRLASNLVLKTQTRDLNTALALAKFAVQYDESNDWRNQVTLAACYKQLGNDEQFESEIQALHENTPEEAKSQMNEMLADLTATQPADPVE